MVTGDMTDTLLKAKNTILYDIRTLQKNTTEADLG